MTRTLITGCSGFTGRYLAALLASYGHEVHGIIQSDHGAPIEGAKQLHVCNLSDSEELVRIVQQTQPRHVVHLASIAFVAHGDVDEMYQTNVVGTRHLLEAIAQASPQLQSVLLASSANIYGNASEGVLDESILASPANDYAVTKLAMEYVANLYRDRLPLIIARPFNYTGLHQNENFLIPKIIAHVRRRAAEIELGNLDVERDFSDVRGVVDAYARLLANPQAINGTFNVCSGKAVSLREVLDMVRRLSGHDFTVQVNPQFVRPNEVRSLCGTAQKLEAIIGPLHIPPLEETLRWMLDGESCA